jgi:hypothetical protein
MLDIVTTESEAAHHIGRSAEERQVSGPPLADAPPYAKRDNGIDHKRVVQVDPKSESRVTRDECREIQRPQRCGMDRPESRILWRSRSRV